MDEELTKIAKKGTTTVGITFDKGVVLAADKRASMGNLVAHTGVDKIHKITNYIAMTMAGLVGDNQMLVRYLKSQVKLLEIRQNEKVSVKATSTLLSHILFSNRFSPFPFYVQIILGGVDKSGPHVFSLGADGSNIEDKYLSTGSGSPVAYGVLENNYKENMTEKEAVSLAIKAINSAIKRDTYTGNGIDVFVINNKGCKRLTPDEIKKYL